MIMENTETAQEEKPIVWRDEKIILDEGEFVFKQREGDIEETEVEIAGIKDILPAGIRTQVNMFINGKQFAQYNLFNIHELSEEKRVEEIGYSIYLLKKHYAKKQVAAK